MTNLVICASRNKRTTILRGERLATSIGGGRWCAVSPDTISSSLTSQYPKDFPKESSSS